MSNHSLSLQSVTALKMERVHYPSKADRRWAFDVMNLHITDADGDVFVVKMFVHNGGKTDGLGQLVINDPDAPAPEVDPVDADAGPIPASVAAFEQVLMSDGAYSYGPTMEDYNRRFLAGKADEIGSDSTEVPAGESPDHIDLSVSASELDAWEAKIDQLGDTLAKQVQNRRTRTYMPGLLSREQYDEVRGWDEAGEVDR